MCDEPVRSTRSVPLCAKRQQSVSLQADPLLWQPKPLEETHCQRSEQSSLLGRQELLPHASALSSWCRTDDDFQQMIEVLNNPLVGCCGLLTPSVPNPAMVCFQRMNGRSAPSPSSLTKTALTQFINTPGQEPTNLQTRLIGCCSEPNREHVWDSAGDSCWQNSTTTPTLR